MITSEDNDGDDDDDDNAKPIAFGEFLGCIPDRTVF